MWVGDVCGHSLGLYSQVTAGCGHAEPVGCESVLSSEGIMGDRSPMESSPLWGCRPHIQAQGGSLAGLQSSGETPSRPPSRPPWAPTPARRGLSPEGPVTAVSLGGAVGLVSSEWLREEIGPWLRSWEARPARGWGVGGACDKEGGRESGGPGGPGGWAGAKRSAPFSGYCLARAGAKGEGKGVGEGL